MRAPVAAAGLSALILLGAAPALAEDRPGDGDGSPAFFGGADIVFHLAAGEVDLAAQAGADGPGSGNDLSPGTLGLRAGFGIRPFEPVELAAQGSIAIGGLALADIERRYFGAEPQQLGSTATVEAGGSLRAVPELVPSLRLVAGGQLGWHRMAASSPAGLARLDSLTVGPQVGVRWALGEWTQLQLLLEARAHVPTYVNVQGGPGQVLFDRGAAADPFFSAGVAAGMLFARR